HGRKALPLILIPIKENLLNWITETIRLPMCLKADFLTKQIDEISNEIKNIEDRAELICIIEQNQKQFTGRYSLLINRYKKVINKENSVFTPYSDREEDLNIPDFI